MDDDDRLIVYRVFESPSVRKIDRFKKSFKRHNKRKGKESKEQSENSFKRDFLKRFGLDKNRFSVNLIKSESKWLVEICNKRTNRCVYHDYQTLYSILDKRCKLPDTVIGLNVNREA